MANRFLGTKVTKKVKFMGGDIDISKLTVAQVMKIQEIAKEASDTPSEETNLKLLNIVIKQGAQELADLTDEDMLSFPMDELSKLSAEIMKYSGLVQEK